MALVAAFRLGQFSSLSLVHCSSGGVSSQLVEHHLAVPFDRPAFGGWKVCFRIPVVPTAVVFPSASQVPIPIAWSWGLHGSGRGLAQRHRKLFRSAGFPGGYTSARS